MNKGPKIALITVVGAGAVAGGYWYYQKRKAVGSTTPSVTLSSSPPSSSSSSTTPSSSSNPTSTATATYLGGKQANAQGQTVTLQVPPSGTAGGSLTVAAQPSGFSNPMYQFWVKPPSSALGFYTGHSIQNGWVNWYGYGSNSTVVIPTPVAGTYHIAGYAREAFAPTHEAAAQRAIYEATSGNWQVPVS